MTREAPIALTPLARLRVELLAVAGPVPPHVVPPFAGVGAVLAETVAAATPIPPRAVALIAGHAVASVETVGASPYAPATPSRLVAVAAGDALPPGTDAVVPVEAVVRDFGFDSVQQSVAPGENLRRAGEDFAEGRTVAAAGERLGARTALLAAAIGRDGDGVAIRRPTVVLGHDGDPAAIRAAAYLAAHFGDGRATIVDGSVAEAVAAEADLRILIGGAEITVDDPAAAAIAGRGTNLGRGVALRGCESLAWGVIGGRPALAVPSRPDSLIAIALTLIEPLVDALAGRADADRSTIRPLARKLVSQVGMSEIALVAESDDGRLWQPLATGDLAWSALAAADAWIELPPESEGLAEATPVAARRLRPATRPLASEEPIP